MTSPGSYVQYGSIAYRVLLYAYFKRGRSFTTTDYREFMLKKIKPERVREAVNYLSDAGYVSKLVNQNPTHHNMKNMYMITLVGEHALMFLASKQKDRERKHKVKVGVANGKARWSKQSNSKA